MLRSCTSIPAGLTVCVPLACEHQHTVVSTDSCLNISLANTISYDTLVNYNPGLNWDCSNLVAANVSWGSTLCVSPPGGPYNGSAGEGGQTANPANPWIGGDGYGEEEVTLPLGVVLALGTTTRCGGWYSHTADKVDGGCTRLTTENKVIISLFPAANPSLGDTASCNANLAVGKTYCVHSLVDWQGSVMTRPTVLPSTTTTALPTTTSTTSTTTTTSTTSSSTASTSTTISPGSGFVHVGCYEDTNSGHALSLLFRNDSVTPELCEAYVQSLARKPVPTSLPYFFVEYARECYGGSSFAWQGSAVTSLSGTRDCTLVCSDNIGAAVTGTAKCGGQKQFNLYVTGSTHNLPDYWPGVLRTTAVLKRAVETAGRSNVTGAPDYP